MAFAQRDSNVGPLNAESIPREALSYDIDVIRAGERMDARMIDLDARSSFFVFLPFVFCSQNDILKNRDAYIDNDG